jgi:hypothetical protein
MSLLSKTAALALEVGADSPLGRELVPLVREARDFTKKEWETYLKDHPKADKSKHNITDSDGGKGEDEDEGEKKDKGKSKEEVHKEIEEKQIDVKPPADEEVLVEFSGEIPDYHLEIIAGGEGGEITEADLRRAKAIKVQLSRGIEKAADICNMSPPVCKENLGVFRESMPQLSADESIKTMMMSDEERIADNGDGDGFSSPSKGWKKVPWDQLSDEEQAGNRKDWATARKKGQAAIDAGADPDDDRTVFQQLLDGLAEEGTSIGSQDPPYEKVEVGKLKATQREIKAGKTFGMANSYLSGQYDPRKAPIIISSDNHILDGHHRYAAMVTADPEAAMNVIRVDMPMSEFLEKSFEQPGVFRADLQDNIVDSDKPLDLSRAKGSTWQQPGNDGWYAKDNDGNATGPYKDEEAAKAAAKGEKAEESEDDEEPKDEEPKDEEPKDEEKEKEEKGKKAHLNLREAAIWLAAENIGPLSEALLPIINGARKRAARLDLGRVVMTSSVDHWVRKDVSTNSAFIRSILQRHQRGDWGEVKGQDKRENDRAFKNGDDRILSVYHAPDKTKFWIITEWDRSATTVLFPSDY